MAPKKISHSNHQKHIKKPLTVWIFGKPEIIKSRDKKILPQNNFWFEKYPRTNFRKTIFRPRFLTSKMKIQNQIKNRSTIDGCMSNNPPDHRTSHLRRLGCWSLWFFWDISSELHWRSFLQKSPDRRCLLNGFLLTEKSFPLTLLCAPCLMSGASSTRRFYWLRNGVYP